MTKAKLTYFDAPMSRGEECRMALHIAGVDFEDVRVKQADWAALKPRTPFGSLPFLELPGHPPLAQSNAILVLIGRRHGLHPKDDFEAARHEAMMQHVEDLRAAIAPTMRMKDEADRKRARDVLVESYIPLWGASAERQIESGPFFGGAALHVVDLKLHMVYRWISGGKLDHIPPTVLSAHPKLVRVHEAVGAHDGVRSWRARTQQTG